MAAYHFGERMKMSGSARKKNDGRGKKKYARGKKKYGRGKKKHMKMSEGVGGNKKKLACQHPTLGA